MSLGIVELRISATGLCRGLSFCMPIVKNVENTFSLEQQSNLLIVLDASLIYVIYLNVIFFKIQTHKHICLCCDAGLVLLQTFSKHSARLYQYCTLYKI